MKTISPEQQMEELSFSYLHAVCARIGASMIRHENDNDGIDGSVKKRVFLSQEGSDVQTPFDATFDFQLKSTAQKLRQTDDFIAYPLKIENYNALRYPVSTKRLLLLLDLPENFEDALKHSVESLAIFRCMYWLILKDAPESDNKSTITVKIPKENVASPEKLDEILHQIAEDL